MIYQFNIQTIMSELAEKILLELDKNEKLESFKFASQISIDHQVIKQIYIQGVPKELRFFLNLHKRSAEWPREIHYSPKICLFKGHPVCICMYP